MIIGKTENPKKARGINLLKDGNTIGRIELIRMEAFHRQILLQGPGLNTLGITEKISTFDIIRPTGKV